MTDMINIASHCMVTIRRPNGSVETVNYTEATKGQVRSMNTRTLEVVNKAMAAAKRGQIISYENITKSVEAAKPTAADLAEDAYLRSTAATYRMAAGGERHS